MAAVDVNKVALRRYGEGGGGRVGTLLYTIAYLFLLPPLTMRCELGVVVFGLVGAVAAAAVPTLTTPVSTIDSRQTNKQRTAGTYHRAV